MASSGTDAGGGSNAVVAFSRAADSGAVTWVGCVSDSGGDGRAGSDGFCANGDALLGAGAIAVSPAGASRAVRTRLGKRLRRTVRKRGRAHVVVRARDSRGLTRATTRRLLVRRAR